MLKWAVTQKRDAKCEVSRPLPDGSVPIKRRESAPCKLARSKRRRSSTGRKSAAHCDDEEKENQYTSTPIKSCEGEALKDIINLTPKERRLTLAKQDDAAYKEFASGRFKQKRKKRCLDPTHSKSDDEFFKPFETVDSHVRSLLVENTANHKCASKSKTPYHQDIKKLLPPTYAPTLPTYFMEYSPLAEKNLLPPSICCSVPRLKSSLDDAYPPHKKARIEHVNDFLHQISQVAALDEESASAKVDDATNVSPLVQRLVDLRFNKHGCDKRREGINDSSFINELSLNQLVDAILDSSAEADATAKMQEKEAAPADKNLALPADVNGSIDSGFRSNSTENSHHIDSNYICKCNKTTARNSSTTNEKTVINLSENYNERCIDPPTTRKRCSSSASDADASQVKRRAFPSNNSIVETANFTLKRQKCVRRRKNSSVEKARKVLGPKVALPEVVVECKSNEEGSVGVCESDMVSSLEGRKTRRCLNFESPKCGGLKEWGGGGRSSTPKDEERVGGIMYLRIFCGNGELVVQVDRCWDLHRYNGKQINAYVKVFLSERFANDSRKTDVAHLQRTPVQANSAEPIFNHTFRIPLQRNADFQQRLHLEVWHRDRYTRRSEFLGCMSFAVRDAADKEICGWYRLLPQPSGCHQNVPVADHHHPLAYTDDTMTDSQSSVEELLSVDDLEADLLRKAPAKPATSQQQKDADENLFLRYLELDPTEGPEAANAALQRKATGNKNGRTPFTITKRLMKASKCGFGFSVVWTHPPRIERVEKGMPAEKAGIVPGDYVIFVDKQNVVMMPEIDILNLIRSYGNQLTLEIFRRNSSKNGSVGSMRRLNSASGAAGSATGLHAPVGPHRRPSTVCSTNTATASVELSRRKLHLPQVTFSAEKTTGNPEENRRKAIYQLISKEQQYATGLQYAITRFVSALKERKDLITNAEHRILFQNAEELLHITEEILEAVVPDSGDISIELVVPTYRAKLQEITTAYKRYCSGIKRADCILANKTKNAEFARFLQTPAIPRRRPDLTVFIHKPLEHFRELLKLLNAVLSCTPTNHDDYTVICQIVHDMQLSYREITVGAGLMEPIGEGRPLLSVQDLESRLVFTKCKPFVLSKPGRQWIFGGDLSRVEGRNVRQYWALLFNDLLLFAKASRDRVLFVTEEPIPLAHITDLCFNIRKKVNEFRIRIDPGGRLASSPTIHCGPDLSRTPKRSAGRKTMLLRAPTLEMKAVWQNLLQRQILHVNSGMDGSAFSSPLESPDAPVTSSVVTLQSAESLSYRRQQTPQSLNLTECAETQRQIDEIIEHKCKQLSKTNSSTKSNAIHLEQWMKGQLGRNHHESVEVEPEIEMWTLEMVRKRSEELQLLDTQLNKRSESRCEEIVLSDHEQSPSKSTTTESQVTVRSSPLVPETIPVCRQCHKTCLNKPNNNPIESTANGFHENNEDWQPLMLIGLNAAVPARSLVKLDPFATPLPEISVVPPTPDSLVKVSTNQDDFSNDHTCKCWKTKPQLNDLELRHDFDNSPDESPINEDHPYHSLSSSNLTLKRYGTVSSLERFAGNDEDHDDGESRHNSSESDGSEEGGVYNDGFNGGTGLKNWTARAGSFVIEKMAFFERYLKTNENQMNGDDIQEDEASGATSGEEVWGTPTSGGEIEDSLSSPNCDGRYSPNDGSISSDNDESTELMMDELLMTPPITGATIRGLLPRRTLEPLLEEEYSESCSSSSTQTETSASPEQGNEIGGAADTCSSAAGQPTANNVAAAATARCDATTKMHRSDSYRHIIEAEDENAAFISPFSSTAKYIDIKSTSRSRTVKIFGFFNVRRERRIHECFPEGKHLIKLFSKDDCVADVSASCPQKQISQRILKDKQVDRRFWKQLSRRRGGRNTPFPA